MKKNYTFDELESLMRSKGCNLADVAIGEMMDIIYDETGTYPSWSDIAPEWVVKNCIG